MTETTTTFPEFENSANIEGTVYSSSIERKEFKDQKGNPYWALTGRIVVRTGENESHTAQYFVKEMTAKGEPNKIYTNVKTVLDDLVTIEKISEDKALKESGVEPTKVRIRGELSLNEYYNDADILQSQLQVRGVFLNRVKEDQEFNPHAKYDIEGIVIKSIAETIDEEETGRQKVTVLIPTYNNALPVEFVSRPEDGEYIADNFETGTSVNLYGKIVNFSKKVEKEIEAGFGENKIETKYENTREVQITGGKVYDEDSNKAITQEQFKELQARRNTALATIKERSEQAKANKDKDKDKKAGFGQGASGAKTGGGKAKVDVSGMF